MRSEKWDKRFMLLAHQIADWSKEEGRRVGSIIVSPDLEVRSTGYNGFPRGVNDDVSERHSSHTGAKYKWSSHAERNAIYNAARIGIPLKGCTIYVPWFPCIECSKAIIQSGIVELVAYQPDYSDPTWGNDFQLATEMLNEASVKVRFISKIQDLLIGTNTEPSA